MIPYEKLMCARCKARVRKAQQLVGGRPRKDLDRDLCLAVANGVLTAEHVAQLLEVSSRTVKRRARELRTVASARKRARRQPPR